MSSFHFISYFNVQQRKGIHRERKQRKKFMMPRRKNMQYQDHMTIDLTDYCVLDKQPSKAKLIVPCSSRKRKLVSK